MQADGAPAMHPGFRLKCALLASPQPEAQLSPRGVGQAEQR
ncbi:MULTISPECIES: hypothetical protein [unclassified Nonomuraea]